MNHPPHSNHDRNNGTVDPANGYTKEFFSVYNEATPAFGAFAPYNTENLPDFDRAATVFGSIDSLATGEMTADEYQSTLADAWVKLSENKTIAE